MLCVRCPRQTLIPAVDSQGVAPPALGVFSCVPDRTGSHTDNQLLQQLALLCLSPHQCSLPPQQPGNKALSVGAGCVLLPAHSHPYAATLHRSKDTTDRRNLPADTSPTCTSSPCMPYTSRAHAVKHPAGDQLLSPWSCKSAQPLDTPQLPFKRKHWQLTTRPDTAPTPIPACCSSITQGDRHHSPCRNHVTH
jgi:hypothetical protein